MKLTTTLPTSKPTEDNQSECVQPQKVALYPARRNKLFAKGSKDLNIPEQEVNTWNMECELALLVVFFQLLEMGASVSPILVFVCGVSQEFRNPRLVAQDLRAVLQATGAKHLKLVFLHACCREPESTGSGRPGKHRLKA